MPIENDEIIYACISTSALDQSVVFVHSAYDQSVITWYFCQEWEYRIRV